MSRKPNAVTYGTAMKFHTLHVRSEESEQRVLDLLAGLDSGPRIVVLRGFPGSGRRYCLESAAYRATEHGQPTTYFPLDLRGAEPGQRLADYLKARQVQHEQLKPVESVLSMLSIELASELTEFGSVAASLAFGVPVSLLVRVAGALRSEHEDALIPGEEFDRLQRLVRAMREGRRAIIHVTDRDLNRLQRRLLCDLTRVEPVLLAVSLDAAEGLGPYSGSPVLDFEPVSPQEVEAWCERMFGPHVPAGLVEKLARFGDGRPGHLVGMMARLLEDQDKLLPWEGGGRRLRLDDPQDAMRFSHPYWNRTRAVIEDWPLGKRIIAASIACGRYVPIGLVLDALGVEGGPERTDAIDRIDREWVDSGSHAIFEDLGFGQVDVPNVTGDNAIYSWVDDTLLNGLGQWVGADELTEAAAAVLPVVRAKLRYRRSRAILELLRSLSACAGEAADAERLALLLDWYVGRERAAQLGQAVAEELRAHPERIDFVARALTRPTAALPAEVQLSLVEAVLDVTGVEDEGSSTERVDLALDLELDRPLRWRRAALTGETGDAAKALELYRALAEDCERALGPDARDTLAARGQVAYWTGETGGAAEALRLYEAVAADSARALGRDDRYTLAARGQVASLTGATGGAAEALRLYEAVADDRARALGPDDRDTLAARGQVAYLTGATRGAAEALRLYEAAADDRARALGPDDRDTLAARAQVAYYTGKTGDKAKALRLYEAVAQDCARALGPDDSDTLVARAQVAYYTGETGDAAGALELYRTLAEDCARALGGGHPLTQSVRQNIEWFRTRRD